MESSEVTKRKAGFMPMGKSVLNSSGIGWGRESDDVGVGAWKAISSWPGWRPKGERSSTGGGMRLICCGAGTDGVCGRGCGLGSFSSSSILRTTSRWKSTFVVGCFFWLALFLMISEVVERKNGVMLAFSLLFSVVCMWSHPILSMLRTEMHFS